ncbi:hypothetical protein DPM13_16395 [Paracoccus mutanolyticus]|uniref:Uncharacterized protein n=1 Tax=Paracoccus mutanolyticus TaxID=1499308 RepID=A0ABM6WTT3_9RHOB|nr:hypothetical protein [Paracoccus mutanolyticus]AWX93998.1 hypothetical protein DPM13_16395 [Paracoccus mutanolyticus]
MIRFSFISLLAFGQPAIAYISSEGHEYQPTCTTERIWRSILRIWAQGGYADGLVAIALANKIWLNKKGRQIWAMLTRNEDFWKTQLA